MRKILTVAALMGGMLAASAALAENSSTQTDTGGTSTGPVANAANEPMVVNVDNGTVREQPNPQSRILTTVPRGHQVTVLGTGNTSGWAHVMVDGLDGYMDMIQLNQVPSQTTYYYSTGEQPVRYMLVTADGGNLWSAPTPGSQVLTVLPRGAQVTVIGAANGGTWGHVQVNGLDGYMDFVQLADVAQPNRTVVYRTYPAYPTYQTYPTTQAYPTTPSYTTYRTTYQTYPTYQYQSTTPVYYSPATRFVNGGGGTIYQFPDSQSSLVTTLPPGYQVSVVGTVNGYWAHVVANGLDGYMPYGELQ